MAGFLDVLLRGLLLTFVAIAVGGVAWVRLVLRAAPHTKPDAAAAASLRMIAVAAGLAAVVQATIVVLLLGDLAARTGALPLGSSLETTFARVALGRIALSVTLGLMAARLAARPGGRVAWAVLTTLGLALVVSSAALSHAVARVNYRGLLLLLDSAHQLAVGVWVGGLAHLTLHAARVQREPHLPDGLVARRFSSVALAAVATLVGTGAALSVMYVAEWAALVGTAYGVMVLSKVVLLAVALGPAAVSFGLVRRAVGSTPTLWRLVEVELGLVITVLFAAASLTSLPPAVDVRVDRATVSEVAARFAPMVPRLASPPIDELLRAADPLMAPPGERRPVERAWSESNHHWAGLFVLTMGLLAVLERLGLPQGRHWPLALLGLAAFLFIRNDPRAWPLGPAGFWESMTLPDVLQHRLFVLLIVGFGIFEWMVRTGRVPPRPWGYVFPLLCAVGGGLLLTHSHAMFNRKEEFLIEVTHAPVGILGAFAGWARWLEVRIPEATLGSGWFWRGCLVAVGLLLMLYRES